MSPVCSFFPRRVRTCCELILIIDRLKTDERRRTKVLEHECQSCSNPSRIKIIFLIWWCAVESTADFVCVSRSDRHDFFFCLFPSSSLVFIRSLSPQECPETSPAAASIDLRDFLPRRPEHIRGGDALAALLLIHVSQNVVLMFDPTDGCQRPRLTMTWSTVVVEDNEQLTDYTGLSWLSIILPRLCSTSGDIVSFYLCSFNFTFRICLMILLFFLIIQLNIVDTTLDTATRTHKQTSYTSTQKHRHTHTTIRCVLAGCWSTGSYKCLTGRNVW